MTLKNFGHVSGNSITVCRSCAQYTMTDGKCRLCATCAVGSVARELAIKLRLNVYSYYPVIELGTSASEDKARIPVDIALKMLETLK